MQGVVRQDRAGSIFVEADGRRYDSPELDAPEGTEVEVEPFTGFGDIACATLSWTLFESSYTVLDAREDPFWTP